MVIELLMKYQNAKSKLLSLSKVSFVCCALISTTAISYSRQGSTRETLTPNGPAYLPPKHLSIHPFNLSSTPVYVKAAGSLTIEKNGSAKLYLPCTTSSKVLDKKATCELLGEALGPQGEDENNSYFWTFDVMTFHPSGNNLYHIDAQFDDAGLWKSYRVRGYQINPEWHPVDRTIYVP